MISGGGLTDHTVGSLWILTGWGRIVGQHNPTLQILMADLYNVLTAYDYWLAGDTGEDSVEKAWKRFRGKWIDVDTDVVTDILTERMVKLIGSFELGHQGEQ